MTLVGDEILLLLAQVAVEPVPAHPGRNIDIVASVTVEVGKLDGPGPVRGRQATEVGDFHKTTRAGVEVNGIAHVLARGGEVEEPRVALAAGHVAHRHLLLVVSAARHVGGHVVQAPVIVDVCHVGSHGKPRGVGQHIGSDIAETAVPVVPVEPVRSVEIIGDIKVDPAVGIEIPPGCGKPVSGGPDPCDLAYIREPRAPGIVIAVIAKKVVELGAGHLLVFAARHLHQACKLGIAVGKDRFAIRTGGDIESCLQESGRGFDAICDEIEIEIAITIVVGKGRHQACSSEGQTTAPGHIGEGAVTAIEIEAVCRPKHADE